MIKDYHIHTVVSDGYIIPDNIFVMAEKLGIGELSITDHDALGAYRHFHPDLVSHARTFGLSLITGIELDSQYRGVEVHILGYGIDLECASLNAYLSRTQELRRQRIREQIRHINTRLGPGTLDEETIFLPYRDTVMKPHLIHPLLERGLFSNYREAEKWIRREAPSSIQVPKPAAEEMIALIRQAGGYAVLAHPGYYIKEHEIQLSSMLADLLPAGLEGIEVEYPYRQTSPHFPGPAEERAMVGHVSELAAAHGLKMTRGSDAHRLAEMEQFQ